jgi:hypothetical protein
MAMFPAMVECRCVGLLPRMLDAGDGDAARLADFPR